MHCMCFSWHWVYRHRHVQQASMLPGRQGAGKPRYAYFGRGKQGLSPTRACAASGFSAHWHARALHGCPPALQDLAAGYMSGKLLLKLDAIGFLLTHHTSGEAQPCLVAQPGLLGCWFAVPRPASRGAPAYPRHPFITSIAINSKFTNLIYFLRRRRLLPLPDRPRQPAQPHHLLPHAGAPAVHGGHPRQVQELRGAAAAGEGCCCRPLVLGPPILLVAGVLGEATPAHCQRIAALLLLLRSCLRHASPTLPRCSPLIAGLGGAGLGQQRGHQRGSAAQRGECEWHACGRGCQTGG